MKIKLGAKKVRQMEVCSQAFKKTLPVYQRYGVQNFQDRTKMTPIKIHVVTGIDSELIEYLICIQVRK